MNENTTIKLQAEIKVSSRDVDLVTMVANDLRPKDISLETGLNLRTVEQRIFSIRKKYKVNTLSGLVALFIRNEIIK